MLQAVMGVSDELDALEAMEDVINECVEQLAGRKPTAGFLFTSCMDAEFNRLLELVDTAFPGLQLIGCTTDGEISSQEGFAEDSVALLLLCSDSLSFAAAIAENFSASPVDSLQAAYADCCNRLDATPRCGFVLPDGLTTIGVALDEVLQEVGGMDFPFFGGTAGDHYLFKTTYQFCNGKVYTDAAAILLLGGKCDLRVSVENGWTPIGSYYPVDHYEKNTVHTIDGKTALEFYEEHLGQYQPALTHVPLALYEKEGGEFCLRDSLYVSKEDGSIQFVGNFFDKGIVRLTTVFRDDVISAADRANDSILQETGSCPELVLVFSCTTRRQILGSRTNDELRKLQNYGRVPFFGFYCYGEIAPFAIGEPTRFQNDSYVVVSLSEPDG